MKQLDNSLWAWAEVAQHEKDEFGRPKWKHEVVANDFQADLEFVAAFTGSELGEMLPVNAAAPLPRKWSDGKWRIHATRTPKHGEPLIMADTEADARAKMFVYLIEDGLYRLTGN